MAVHVRIAHTWDGVPLADRARASLAVVGEPEHLRIEVDAPYHGDPPPIAPPGPVDGLWEYEVVEWFVAGTGGRYLEVEVGPHGHHLVLTLSGVRQVEERALPIDYQAQILGDRWRGVARLPRAWLPPGPHRHNAYAIAGVGAGRVYAAATPLPGAKPDFHQPDRFPPVTLP
jgi:hypothetical protein